MSPTRVHLGPVERSSLIGSIVMLAGATWLLPVALGGHAAPSGTSLPWWVMVVPFALFDGIELRLRVGRSVVFATLVELPYVVALFVLPGADLLAALLLGGVLALVALRYRSSMILWNVSGFALECCLALLVFHAVATPGHALDLRGWAGAALAMVACAFAGSFRTMVFGRFRGRRIERVAIDEMWVSVVVAIINATVAFLGLRLVLLDPRLGWLVAGLAVVMAAGYRNYISLLSHHEGLNQLYESTRSMEVVAEQASSVRTMLDQALELLAAEEADLVVGAPDGSRIRQFRAAREVPAYEAEAPAEEALVAVLRSSDGDRFGSVASDDRRTMVARLQGADEPIAVLRVRTTSGASFAESDRRLFEMFVNHASVALQNSQLVDQLRAEVAQREHEALHDSLTALPNRVMFDLQTRRALLEQGDELVAVALIDLDHFKEVNDTLGHRHGDELLAELARRLEDLAHERSLVVCRLGGDEFAVLMEHMTDLDEVASVAAATKAALESPIEIAGVRIDSRASVGVAVSDPTETIVDHSILLRQADVAMYIAKGQHRGVVFYDRSDDPYSPKRLSLAADLRHAVERGEIEAYFQPEVDLHTGEVVSVEALARWTHHEHGSIVPDQFIPIAEQSGLIRDLTYLMLDQSLERIRQWRSHGFQLNVAVNLSVRCLADEGLVGRVTRSLDRAGLGPECLTLEVTEGTIMADPDHALAVLGRLHDVGIRLSIDDFGMGYSSLAQLKRMPVGQLKIDRSFVTFVSEDRDDAAIVKSVTDLGHNLGLEVIAEGCEDQITLDALVSLGCDSVQGFFIGRPMSADRTLRWLRERAQQDAPVGTPNTPTGSVPRG